MDLKHVVSLRLSVVMSCTEAYIFKCIPELRVADSRLSDFQFTLTIDF